MQDSQKGDNVGRPLRVIVMGPSGCGKTSVGTRLAEMLAAQFYDADDFHSATSVAKMQRGEALSDADRQPWLKRLAGLIHDEQQTAPLVLACSALKSSYRRLLSEGPCNPAFFYLKVSASELARRLSSRQGHYAGVSLLESQLQALQPPSTAETLDGELDVQSLCRQIQDRVMS